MAAKRKKETILVIEDDAAVLDALCDFLQLKGFDVATARNGSEALDRLKTSPRPCLILLDLLMPTMDGWEFRRRQKKDPTLAEIPVIVISAVSGARTIDANAVLHKPVNVDRLIATIDQYC
ncbi:MAG: hypothetical protein JWM69_70 [Candidatus Binatus sp.]|jgi:CheY-like chemotaxis protein|nr:hypothetical protein [Candidatus Binatus sp.]